MSRGFVLFVLVAVAAVSGGWLFAQPPLPGAAVMRRAPTAEQIAQWVDDLDASEFLARETAMLRLIAAGEPAISPVQNVFGGGNLEATSRALHVLQQIGLSSDPQTQEAARAALVQAAQSKENPVTARRAVATLERLTELRSKPSLDELAALGAKIAHPQSFDGVVIEDVVESLEIGPEFKGTVDDLRRLKWLRTGRLVLVGSQVTDSWLAHVAPMNGLAELHLHTTAITERGLAALADQVDLRQVGIYYTALDGKALDHLAGLPALSFVKLYGTKIPPAAVAQFQEKHGIAVDARRGAFLGVGCSRGENSCVLTSVHKDSPAEKAGLKEDDLLVRFGTSKVTDFDGLTALISQLDAGDAVEVEVRREIVDEQRGFRLENVTAKVTLGPWGVEPAVLNGWRP